MASQGEKRVFKCSASGKSCGEAIESDGAHEGSQLGERGERGRSTRVGCGDEDRDGVEQDSSMSHSSPISSASWSSERESMSASGKLSVGWGIVGGGVSGFWDAKSCRRMTGGESRTPARWVKYKGSSSPASSGRGIVDFEVDEVGGGDRYSWSESAYNSCVGTVCLAWLRAKLIWAQSVTGRGAIK